MAAPDVDIRHVHSPLYTDDEKVSNGVAETIFQNLCAVPVRRIDGETVAERVLPSELIYDEKGLQIYDIKSQTAKYYPFHLELSILQKHGSDIARRMFSGPHTPMGVKNASLIELGAGSLKKVTALLAGVQGLIPSSIASASYIAVDLDECELKRTLGELYREHCGIVGSAHEGKVTAKGICADYNNDLGWISAGDFDLPGLASESHHVILFLGSTLANAPPEKATALLRRIRDTGMRPGDMILIGLDQCQDVDRVLHSYSDVDGHATALYRNGLHNAAKLAGMGDALDPRDFEYYAVYNQEEGCHERYMRASRDVVVTTQTSGPSGKQWRVTFAKGDLVLMGVSYKWSSQQVHDMFTKAGLETVRVWMDEERIYSITLLVRAE